ncbi:hypothetical protein SO694_00153042 [Aureococcus anophagefferens]|uniref:Uncharacterized protein n=1 Tax=Aureococcus anophagefferens TaxID=44056 RepID=A0ABR1G009_AURAN
MFHFRIWSDRRDGLFASSADGAKAGRAAPSPSPAGPGRRRGRAAALEGVATVAAFDALHGFVHKKLPPAPRNLRAAKQPKFHYDGFGDGAATLPLGEPRVPLRLAAAGPSGRF